MNNSLVVVTYFFAILRRSTNRPMEQLNSPSKKKKNDFTQLRATLVWNLFWETRHQCTINYNVKSFISMMLDLVRTVKTNEVCFVLVMMNIYCGNFIPHVNNVSLSWNT